MLNLCFTINLCCNFDFDKHWLYMSALKISKTEKNLKES